MLQVFVDDGQLIFIDTLTGEETTVNASGERYTILWDRVLGISTRLPTK